MLGSFVYVKVGTVIPLNERFQEVPRLRSSQVIHKGQLTPNTSPTAGQRPCIDRCLRRDPQHLRLQRLR